MNQGKKNDQGKPRMDLISPEALTQLAKVLTFGATRYDAHNWRKGMDWSRLIAAAMRHLNAFNKGEDLDPESGLPHPAHVMACMSFLLEYMAMGSGVDDRYKAGVVSKNEPRIAYDAVVNLQSPPTAYKLGDCSMPDRVVAPGQCCEP